MMRSFALAALALALLGGAPASAGPLKVGKPAPDFHVTTLDGQQLSLADFKGQVLVLNFWATWCGPCRKELPLLDAYEQIQGKYGFKVLAVTADDTIPLSRLKPLAAVLTMKMVRHFKGDYGVLAGLPTNYVIDRAGVLRYAKAGAFDVDSLNDTLVPLLREPAPDAGAGLKSQSTN